MQDPLTQASQSVYDNPFSNINASRSECEGNEINKDDHVGCTESPTNTGPTIDGSSNEFMELKFSCGSEFQPLKRKKHCI